MIPPHRTLTVARLDPRAVAVCDADHGCPMVAAQVAHYVDLLTRLPTHDTDPIVVRRAGDLHWVMNGRHRLAAHIVAGRATILALIYEELGHERLVE